MPTTDLFAQVKYQDGEEVVRGDLDDSQSFLAARLADQMLRDLIPHVEQGTPYDADYQGNNEDAVNLFNYALTLAGGSAYLRKGSANNTIQIAPGTLYQKVAAKSGTAPGILAFTFDGTGDQFTIANGDPANPRVDLLQMKLELIDDDLQSRTVFVAGTKADLDLAAHTTHIDTKVRAKVAGTSGRNISVSLAPNGGAGVAYSENGNAILIKPQSGVSTVADIEAAIIANSTLIEIEAIGTPGNVYVDPADSFAYTPLINGSNDLITTANLDKKHRVQCTLSVKQGVAAASPAYPDPDAGYCVVGGVVVGTNYVAAGVPLLEDTAGAVAVLHDQRMPLGVRIQHTPVTGMLYDPGHYTLTYATWSLLSDGADLAYVPCLVGGSTARVLGVALTNLDTAASTTKLEKFRQLNDGAGGLTLPYHVQLNTTSTLNGAAASRWKRRIIEMASFEAEHAPAAGPTVQASGNKGVAPPVWTNGKRCPDVPFASSRAIDEFSMVVLSVAAPNTARVGTATFWIAGGM